MADNVVLTTPNTEAINKPIVTPGDKGEPPHEWASSTLEALGPAASKHDLAEESQTTSEELPTNPFAADSSSTATTPGVPIPGAYPRESHVRSSSINEDAQYVKETAVNVLETAKEYVFTASEQVGAKVGEYLPESLTSYLPPSLHATNSGSKDPAESAPKPDDVTFEGAPTSLSRGPDESNVETMREGNPSSSLSSSSRDGASPDASVRSLAGSRALDKKSTNTVNESDSYSFTAAPNVAEFPQLNAERMKKAENTTDSGKATAEQDRPNLDHHADETRHIPPVDATAPDIPTETKWHASDPNASGQSIPNVTGRDYPVGTVGPQGSGFTHQDSVRSDKATPGHSDMTALIGASPAMPPAPPGLDDASKGKDKESGGAHGQDDALTRVGNHAVTASSGITAADLAESGAPPAALTAESDATPPQPPAKDNKPPTSETRTPTSTSTSSSDPTQKSTAPSEPAAGKPSSSPSVSQSKAGKTKSGFLDKIKGEMKVLSGKLEHKQEKVEKGRRMMGKAASRN